MKVNKNTKDYKKLEQKLLNIATSKQALEQLTSVEQKTLYLGVYVLNKLRLEK